MCSRTPASRPRAFTRGLVTALLGLTALLTGTLIAAPAGAAEEQGELLLVLDSSGSMKEPDASGSTKIEAAKRALSTVVDGLPEGAQVGLRVYGANVFEESAPGACTDSQLVVPMGPADKPALKRAIDKYRPYGSTPIAHSLKEAAKDVGSKGPRTILLVSDGEETCDPDPCAVARQIHAKGIDLKIDVVGLHVGGAAKRQLTCIADAGGGTYYDAQDAEDLSTSLDQSALRAFKDFKAAGTPVNGALQPGEAPVIGAGQYTDTLAPPSQADGRVKYYMLQRTPGSTLHAAVTIRPEKRTGSAATSEEMKLSLLTPAGDEECTWGHGAAFEFSSSRDFLNASVFQGQNANSSGSAYIEEACKTSDRLLLKVERGDEDGPAAGGEDPMELVVIEEPGVDGVEQLPEAVAAEEVAHGALPAGPTKGDADGGGGFADATTLTQGTWTGTLQPGEQLFYRVEADWGQAPAVTFRLPENPRLSSQLGQLGEKIEIRSYGPDRAEIFLGGGSDGNFISTTRTYSQNQVFHATLPEIRYRNRESTQDEITPVSVAGDYYFAIQQNADGKGREYQEPVEITVAVRGEVAGVPAYREIERATQPPAEDPGQGTGAEAGGDTGAGGAEPAPSASAESAGPATTKVALVAVVGAGGLLVLAGGVVLAVALLRRPKRRERVAGWPQ
jgi:Ca-activated chloride channel homolog